MTAEIAVMNQSAVALAADSAATRSGAKIFTANKIFALSKYEPIAVMVYGHAACMYVPWETIVKEYRAGLGNASYPTVEAYGDAFLKFLGECKSLFPAVEREKFAEESAAARFQDIRRQIVETVDKTVEDLGSLDMPHTRRIIRTVIAERLQKWRDREPSIGIPKDFAARLRKAYRSQVEDAMSNVFENLPLTKTNRGHLLEIVIDSWSKGPQVGFSGLVFVGFGRENIFPALVSHEVDGVLLDHAISWQQRQRTMDHNSAAVIVPFAQQDMIRLFIEGVTPRYEEFVEAYFKKVVEGIDHKERDKLLATFGKDLEEQRRELYVEPLLSIVGSLPMDELASLAESLVNLTSLRRRVSLEDETVGGPIDVAVISRGDGLVWVKRKHYFAPELNPHFFANYYRGDSYDQ